MGQMYGYQLDGKGIYMVEDFHWDNAANSGNGGYVLNGEGNSSDASIQPGYWKFKDTDGVKGINSDDKTVIGNANTDIIGGFPGETQEEFEETCAFVKKVDFYEVHVFKYSKRNGTVAASMPDQIQESVKAERSGILMELAEKQKKEFIDYYKGKEVSVLFEEPVEVDGVRYFEGLTPEYVKVWVPTEENLANRIMTVEFFPYLY